MPTVTSVMADLQAKGSEKGRKTYVRHGIPADRVFGVSVADLKLIAKKIKGQQDLAYGLYNTGNMDAMYLAGMVANGSRMTRDQLNHWADRSEHMPMISEYTVPWVAVENPHGRDLAVQWTGTKKDHVATSGWCTYSGLVATQDDATLDLPEIEELLRRVVQGIGQAPNRVRKTMNGFLIAVGTHVQPLLAQAKKSAQDIGPVAVDVGDTACKVPDAIAYIEKAEKAGTVGEKRKTLRC